VLNGIPLSIVSNVGDKSTLGDLTVPHDDSSDSAETVDTNFDNHFEWVDV